VVDLLYHLDFLMNVINLFFREILLIDGLDSQLVILILLVRSLINRAKGPLAQNIPIDIVSGLQLLIGEHRLLVFSFLLSSAAKTSHFVTFK